MIVKHFFNIYSRTLWFLKQFMESLLTGEPFALILRIVILLKLPLKQNLYRKGEKT